MNPDKFDPVHRQREAALETDAQATVLAPLEATSYRITPQLSAS
jgi:hypothetical protein